MRGTKVSNSSSDLEARLITCVDMTAPSVIGHRMASSAVRRLRRAAHEIKIPIPRNASAATNPPSTKYGLVAASMALAANACPGATTQAAAVRTAASKHTWPVRQARANIGLYYISQILGAPT